MTSDGTRADLLTGDRGEWMNGLAAGSRDAVGVAVRSGVHRGGGAAAVRRTVAARSLARLAREAPDWSILVQLRLSRTLLGLFAGAALALGGCVFQAMLRDALATPYTLGVSTGASLGAVVAIALGWHAIGGVSAVWAAAIAGAACVLFFVLGTSVREHDISPFGLLLAGVATNSVCSALILLVYGLSGMSASFAIARWLIGSLDAIDYRPLAVFIGVVSLLAILIVRRARAWNLLAVGDQWAGDAGHRRAPPDAVRLRRGFGAGRRHRRGDRPDRLHRPGRAAPGARTRQRRRSRAHAVRVLSWRRAAGVVRCARARRACARGSAGRRDYRVHRRAPI